MQDKNSLMLNGVAPQLFKNLILQDHFFCLIGLDFTRIRNSLLWTVSLKWQNRKRQRWVRLLSLYFLVKAILSRIFILPTLFSTYAKDRITLKSQGHCYYHHPHRPCFSGHSAHTERFACSSLTLSPLPGRCLKEPEICSLTHPPVSPFPRVDETGHRGIRRHLFTSFEALSMDRFSLNCRFIKQLMSKISELREIPHRNFKGFSCFHSLFRCITCLYSFNKYLFSPAVAPSSRWVTHSRNSCC